MVSLNSMLKERKVEKMLKVVYKHRWRWTI